MLFLTRNHVLFELGDLPADPETCAVALDYAESEGCAVAWGADGGRGWGDGRGDGRGFGFGRGSGSGGGNGGGFGSGTGGW